MRVHARPHTRTRVLHEYGTDCITCQSKRTDTRSRYPAEPAAARTKETKMTKMQAVPVQPNAQQHLHLPSSSSPRSAVEPGRLRPRGKSNLRRTSSPSPNTRAACRSGVRRRPPLQSLQRAGRGAGVRAREGTGPDSPRSRSHDRLPHHPSGSWPQASTHTGRHRSANTLHRGRPMHRSFAMQRSHDRATSQLAHLPTYALSDVGAERALRSARRSSPSSLQATRAGESRHAQRARADGECVGRSSRTDSIFLDGLRRCV